MYSFSYLEPICCSKWYMLGRKYGAGEDSWESLGKQGDQTLNIHWKNWCWSWNSNALATWCEELTLGKDTDTGKDWGQEKRVTEDEMVGKHLNGHEFEQTPGDDEGQGSLVCCSPWGCKESDTIEWLNNNNNRENKNAGEEGRNCQWHRVKMKLKGKIVLEMSGYQITVGVRGEKLKDLILYIISVALRKSCAKDKEYGSGVELWD